MTVVATDDFNRVGPGLGSNWTTHGGYSAPQIVLNAIPASGGVDYAATYSVADAGQDDMYAQVSSNVVVGDANNDVLVWCRMPNDATETGYMFDYPTYGFGKTWTLQRASSGSFTILASSNAGSVAAGTYAIQVRAVGTAITGWVNGSQVASATDSTHSGSTKRYGGMHIYADVSAHCSIDDFEMGTAGAAAAAPVATKYLYQERARMRAATR